MSKTSKHIPDSVANWQSSNVFTGMEPYFKDIKTYFGQSVYDNIVEKYLAYSKAYLDSFNLDEWHIYGSTRIGIYQNKINLAYVKFYSGNSKFDSITITSTTVVASSYNFYTLVRGNKRYELANHLGNVLTVITDKKIPVCENDSVNNYNADIISATDYSPFGAPLPGRTYNASEFRFGYTGLERDNEIKGLGNSYSTEWRELDVRIVTWWSIDPLTAKYSSHSPYNYTEGNPIVFNDRTGKGKTSTIVDSKGKVVGGKLDGDKGIYMVAGVTNKNFDENKIEDYKKEGVRIGTSASENSFLMEDGKTWTGHINLKSTDALNKIDYATSIFEKSHSSLYGNISAFLDYKDNANNFQDYDIKSWGINKSATEAERIQNYYEASFGPQGLIYTNRDAGNYFAGKASAMMGIPWSIAASGFGALNGAGNSTNGLYMRTMVNLLFYNGFKSDHNLQYKEDKGSFDLQKLGFYSK